MPAVKGDAARGSRSIMVIVPAVMAALVTPFCWGSKSASRLFVETLPCFDVSGARELDGDFRRCCLN